MKFENIIKRLKLDGYKVESMQFDYTECLGANGTALVDVDNGKVIYTTGKYKDVVEQIEKGMSHVDNIEDGKRSLSAYKKYEY